MELLALKFLIASQIIRNLAWSLDKNSKLLLKLTIDSCVAPLTAVLTNNCTEFSHIICSQE